MAKKPAKTSGKAAKSSSKSSPKPPKISASGKPRKKSELFTLLAEHNGLARKQISGVFDTLAAVMAADLAKPSDGRPKVFVVPGLMKVTSRYKPAVPSRKGIDPFTKTEKTFKAKPASTAIKIRPLKALKAMV
ncbi:MAG: HU family DNA-binding protein [Phycisphaeraceae bacterium]|nr:MAG: HU family DNA-binding protein [Phycisphaeraceae bacterium]